MTNDRFKDFTLYELIQAFEKEGYRRGSDVNEIFEDEGIFFLYKDGTPFKVIISVSEGDMFFCNLEVPFYQHFLKNWMELKEKELRRKIRRTTELHALLVSETPENLSDYVDRNFYFFR